MTIRQLTQERTTLLSGWFLPERPGPLIGAHVIHTGNGRCLVDRWPAPQALLVETAGNYTLVGDPDAFTPADLQAHVKGFVDAPDAFVPLLKSAFPDVPMWPRVILELREMPTIDSTGDYSVRRLQASDAQHLWRLDSDSDWIGKTWGGPDGLAESGFAWGAFVAGKLASVACTFFLGGTFEDIGIVTEADYRKSGLAVACTQMLCGDIRARGHRPSWTTSPDNLASLRLAQKLGFAIQRHDRLFVVGIPIPEPA